MTNRTPPSWMREDQVDRAIGAMIGLAVGDALGTTLEFSKRDQHPRHTEMTGGGPFSLQPGEWTDDTAMSLALADSLVANGKFDAKDAMNRFVAWYEKGDYSCTGECFDIGITTKSALHYYQRTGKAYAGSTADDTAGNGSIMRLAPAVLYGLRSHQILVEIARHQSMMTHGSKACLDACEAMARIMRDLILRAPGSSPRYHIDDWSPLDIGIQTVVAGTYLSCPRSDVVSSGHVTATLHAALWASKRSSSFEEALITAVNLGGDADTIGAVTGQIAGATYGFSAIPSRWLEKIAWRERIETLAYDLIHIAPDKVGIITKVARLRNELFPDRKKK